jgi:hypothetical protein
MVNTFPTTIKKEKRKCATRKIKLNGSGSAVNRMLDGSTYPG